MMVPETRTADGFELQIGTNHLGPFALTNLLLPHITDRVVTVASDTHKIGRVKVGDLNWEHRKYRPLGAYNQSKLANLLFTAELQRLLTNSGSAVRAVAAHPGVAETNLITHVGGFGGAVGKLLLRPITQDAAHGSLPTLYAATQDIPGGSYVGPDGLIHTKGYPEVVKPSKASRNAELAKSLWATSARLTQTDFPALATQSG
jgi:NAD(P)-dependent dehydrogenase (short-subunit alcohol dehydrogenase family)